MTVEQYKEYLIKHYKTAIKVFKEEIQEEQKIYDKHIQKETPDYERAITAYARKCSLEDKIKYLTAEIQYVKDGWIEKWGKENTEE